MKPMTPKMADALDKIREAGKVGAWLNAYAAIGVTGTSVNALMRRGLIRREGKYIVSVTDETHDPNEADTIGDYTVWPDGHCERGTISPYSMEDLCEYAI